MQAVLLSGRKEIPGISYNRRNKWRITSKRLLWISEVENAENCAELAIAMRKLDYALRWDSIDRPRHIIHTVYANAVLRAKRESAEGIREYALDLYPSESETAQEEAKSPHSIDAIHEAGTNGLGQTDSKIEQGYHSNPAALDSTAWLDESKLPLWLIRSYEEDVRLVWPVFHYSRRYPVKLHELSIIDCRFEERLPGQL